MADTIKVETGTTAGISVPPVVPANVVVSSAEDGSKMTAQVTGSLPSKESPVLGTEPRPAWLPENFKTPQELAKSYQESQRKITEQGQELAALKKQVPAAQGASGAVSESASTVPSASPGPVDLPGIAAEWAANGGKLSDQSYQRLDQVGISKEAVNQYIAGQQALAERLVSDLEQVAGGKDKLRDVLDYYGSSPELRAQSKSYNEALAKGDVTTAQMLLRDMTNEYGKRVGRDPRVLIRGEHAAVAEEQPFGSWAQVTKAMSDSRYKNDPIYRRSVERRTMAMRA